MSKKKVSIDNMSPIYYFEIIEATKEGLTDIDGKSKLKFTWIYEGKDYFIDPDSATGTLRSGLYVVKDLWRLLKDGYVVKGTTKDGEVKTFNYASDFLAHCFTRKV